MEITKKRLFSKNIILEATREEILLESRLNRTNKLNNFLQFFPSISDNDYAFRPQKSLIIANIRHRNTLSTLKMA